MVQLGENRLATVVLEMTKSTQRDKGYKWVISTWTNLNRNTILLLGRVPRLTPRPYYRLTRTQQLAHISILHFSFVDSYSHLYVHLYRM